MYDTIIVRYNRPYKIIFILLMLGNTIGLFSQEEKPQINRNSVYLDLSTLLIFNAYSLNYERNIFYCKYFKAGFSFGYGGWAFLEGDRFITYWGLPYSVKLLIGSKHHFEIDYGFTRLNPFGGKVKYRDKTYPNMNIGYRFQDFEERSIYRIFIGTNGLGFGYGYNF